MRSLFASLMLVTILPLLSAQEQPKQDPVIYPRGTAGAETPIQPKNSGSSSTAVLAVVLIAAAGGWWYYLKRQGSLRGGIAGKPSNLKIVESRSLGSRQYLVVADYEGKKFLLGVCPGSIELLTPLNGEAPKFPTSES